MPENKPIGRARKDAREGKSPTTQAGEFVREEIEHVREGKHGARSVRQAIAIALSKARRAGVKLPPPKKGKTSARTRAQALRDYRKGRAARRGKVRKVSRRRSRAVLRALRRESRGTASRRALARHARRSARARGRTARHRSAMKAVRTKGTAGLRATARKAARTRKAHRKPA